MQPQIEYCIFDCDGLLLDTEEIYYEIGRAVIGQYGKTFEWSLKSRLMGMPWNEAVDLLLETLDLPITRDEYIAQAKKLEHLFVKAVVLPGVNDLIKHLTAVNIPCAVATSSAQKSFSLKSTSHADFFSQFNAIVLGDDPAVKKGKPHPDIFMEAAHRIARDPHHLKDYSKFLAFEDSPTGVMAARRAGMHVIWIPDPRMDETLFSHDPGVTRIHSMLDFKPELFGLPPFGGK